MIDTLGLTAALAEMVRTVDELQPECTFELRVDDAFPTMQPEVEITAYRLVQEALSNVVKHAQARAVVVRLACSSDPAEVCIIVADDGQGFDIGVTQPGGLGLVGMRERVQAIGGTMHVRSMPGSGTELAFSMPRQI